MRMASTEREIDGGTMMSKKGDNRRIAWRRLRNLLFVPLMIAWALLGVGPGPLPHAQAQPQEESGAVRHIVVTVNKSRTLRLDNAFASAVVGAPANVDALPKPERRI